MLASLMTLSFVLFTVILLVSMSFVHKIKNEPYIISGIILLGFSCIFAGLAWIWESFVLVFLLEACLIGFLIPIITRITSDIVFKKELNKNYLALLPIFSILWIAISMMLFAFMGESWRLLYFVTGVINVLSSLIFLF